MNTLKRIAGFTLIELMIVVAIVGILASLGYPSYTEYIKKGRRSDAKSGLLSLQMAQEKFRSNCPQYATAIGTGMDCATTTLVGSASSPDGYYTLSIVAADATTYSLLATRLTTGKQNGDKCGDYLIDQNGTKSIANAYSGYTVANCW